MESYDVASTIDVSLPGMMEALWLMAQPSMVW